MLRDSNLTQLGGSNSTQHGGKLAVAVVATALALLAMHPAAADDVYSWSAELVEIDESAQTAVVRSMVTSHALVGDLADLAQGERVTIIWSGRSEATGVRAVTPGSGAAEGLALRAEFVASEMDGRYVVFSVPVPGEALQRLGALSPGAWVTMTSPHALADWEEAVVDAQPYAAGPATPQVAAVAEERQAADVPEDVPEADAGTGAREPATRMPSPPGPDITWSAELVALDEEAGAAVVRALVVRHANVGDLSDLTEGERVTISWSGHSRASGIRGVTRGSGAGLGGFELPADFVGADAEGRYITFSVPLPDESLETISALSAGEWITLTSPRATADRPEVVADARPYESAWMPSRSEGTQARAAAEVEVARRVDADADVDVEEALLDVEEARPGEEGTREEVVHEAEEEALEPRTFTATTADMSPAGVTLRMNVLEWSGAASRAAVIDVLTWRPAEGAEEGDAAAEEVEVAEAAAEEIDFAEEGEDGAGNDGERPAARPARPSLAQLPTIGYVWLEGSAIGYAIKYAHSVPMSGDGEGERITLVTDRPLGAYGIQPWSVDGGANEDPAEYSVIELYLDGQGSGAGTLSLAADLVMDDDLPAVFLADGAANLLVDARYVSVSY